ATLEQRERRFDRVGMNVAFDVDASRVLDGFVLRPHVPEQGRRGIIKRTRVAAGIVRDDDFHVPTDVFLNELCQRPTFDILDMEEPQIAVSLSNAEHDVFVGSTSTLPALFDSANVGFIQFNRASQWRTFSGRHSKPNAMAEKPRSLVAHADGSLELIRRHTLPGLTEQQDGEKPCLQGQLRVSEDRARSDAKFVVTGIADQDCASPRDFTLASDTLRGDGPAQTFKQIPATIFIGETRHEITQSHSSYHQKASRRDQETVEKEGGFSYRLCRGLAGRSVRTELHGRSLSSLLKAFALAIFPVVPLRQPACTKVPAASRCSNMQSDGVSA